MIFWEHGHLIYFRQEIYICTKHEEEKYRSTEAVIEVFSFPPKFGEVKSGDAMCEKTKRRPHRPHVASFILTTVGDTYNGQFFFSRHIKSNVLYLQNVPYVPYVPYVHWT